MGTTFQHLGALVILAVLLPATVAAGERTFRWLDEEGNIHYGDRVPPQYSKHERQEFNEQGRTVKVYEAAKTDEEKAELARLAAIEAEQKKLAEQQAVHDRSLLATYASEEDMLLARDGKVSSVEAVVQLTYSRIESTERRLLEYTQEAAEYERSGKKIPKQLQNQITSVRTQIEENKAFLKAKEAERQQIMQQFDADMLRYRELREAFEE